MANYAMFTKLGLNEIANASPAGQYIEIGAFVPVYDYRYDPYIGLISGVTLSALQVSSYTSPSDQYPQGEIIWNTSAADAYMLSPTSDYLKKADGSIDYTGDSIISQYIHSNKVQINTYKNSPITDHYTASIVSNPGVIDNSWHFDPEAVIIATDSNAPTNLSAVDFTYLFNGVSYQPVLLSGTERRANFKVTCRCPVGQFKFNKLGLYGVRRTGTNVISTNPFLLAQVILPSPQILYSNQAVSTSGLSLSEFVLDFQIETKQTPNEFENVFYSTSGDYWKRVINQNDGIFGISYDGFVAITNTLAIDEQQDLLLSSTNVPAKLLVSTFENINSSNSSIEKNMPQQCLQYVDASGNRIRTTLTVVKNGDLNVDMYGACTSANNIPVIKPVYDGEIGLGAGLSGYNRWNHLNLKSYLEITDSNFTNLNNESYDNFYLRADSNTDKLEVCNGNIVNGPRYSELDIENGELVKKDNYWYYHGNISSPVNIVNNNEIDNEDLLLRGFKDVVIGCVNQLSTNSMPAGEIVAKLKTIGSINDQGTDLLQPKDILLVAGNDIKTNGNIIPLKNNTDDIGSPDKIIKDLYVNNLHANNLNTIFTPDRTVIDSLGINGFVYTNIDSDVAVSYSEGTGLAFRLDSNGDVWYNNAKIVSIFTTNNICPIINFNSWAFYPDNGIVLPNTELDANAFTKKSLLIFVVFDPDTNQTNIIASPTLKHIADYFNHTVYVRQIGIVFIDITTKTLRKYTKIANNYYFNDLQGYFGGVDGLRVLTPGDNIVNSIICDSNFSGLFGLASITPATNQPLLLKMALPPKHIQCYIGEYHKTFTLNDVSNTIVVNITQATLPSNFTFNVEGFQKTW